MNRISIKEDDERVTTILARIDDDDGSLTSCKLEIGEGQGKKESGKPMKLTNTGHNSLEFEVEMAQTFMLIRTRRIDRTANEKSQSWELVSQRLSFRARYYDITQGGMESSKLTPKDTPALFEELDCTHRSTFTKTRWERVYCERRRDVFKDDKMSRQWRQSGEMLNKEPKGCFIGEKYGGMLELLSHLCPCSSGRKINGRHKSGHVYELSAKTKQLLHVL
jgi:hypothetical protein